MAIIFLLLTFIGRSNNFDLDVNLYQPLRVHKLGCGKDVYDYYV